MSEAVHRTNLPTGQSLPISQEAPRRRPEAPGRRKDRRKDQRVEESPPAEEPVAAADDETQDSGHIDCLI